MIRLAGEMSIYRAAELKPLLLQAIDEGGPGPVEIDLADVSEFDTAGLQLLMLARVAAGQAGRELRLLAPSPAVQEVFALLDLAAHFGAAPTASAGEPGACA
ncbi:MAG: STAS domain-containing protein [Burkholderiales bacterium]|nr:STAS domain-containing protein [Burkholderiales bacterium]